MFKAKLGGQIEAVLLSAPPRQYFASHAGSGKVKSAGTKCTKMTLSSPRRSTARLAARSILLS